MKEISAEQIATFFQTDFGKRLIREKENVLREFKFSLLVDSCLDVENGSDDQILLQGVVDCAIIDEDGIIILDFKSDRITESTLDGAVERYGEQVKAYAKALSRIYQLPVKSAQLYFFQLNKFVAII